MKQLFGCPLISVFLCAYSLGATSYDVTSFSGLVDAIYSINGHAPSGSGACTLSINQSITLTDSLPVIYPNSGVTALTITGGSGTSVIDGGHAYSIFQILGAQNSDCSVTLSNLVLTSGVSQGGNGANGGGGGAGLGGALLVYGAQPVVVNNVQFSSNRAVGGEGSVGGSLGGGGGGGIGGSGGVGNKSGGGGGGVGGMGGSPGSDKGGGGGGGVGSSLYSGNGGGASSASGSQGNAEGSSSGGEGGASGATMNGVTAGGAAGTSGGGGGRGAARLDPILGGYVNAGGGGGGGIVGQYGSEAIRNLGGFGGDGGVGGGGGGGGFGLGGFNGMAGYAGTNGIAGATGAVGCSGDMGVQGHYGGGGGYGGAGGVGGGGGGGGVGLHGGDGGVGGAGGVGGDSSGPGVKGANGGAAGSGGNGGRGGNGGYGGDGGLGGGGGGGARGGDGGVGGVPGTPGAGGFGGGGQGSTGKIGSSGIRGPGGNGGNGGVGGLGGGGGGGGLAGLNGIEGMGGLGGFGGGEGSDALIVGGSGGGGAGLGGALCVCGNLTIQSAVFENNSSSGGIGGTGATDGIAYGYDCFVGSDSVYSGSITFDLSSDLTMPHAIQGNGSTLIKTGAAKLTLTGEDSTTGYSDKNRPQLAVQVNEGTLALVPTSSSTNLFSFDSVSVNGAGRLQGVGIISGSLRASGGTIHPGNSVGDLSIVQNFNLSPTTVTVVEINPNASSHIIVQNSADLAGTLQIDAASGFYTQGTTYNIIQAAELEQTFGSVLFPNTPVLNVQYDYVHGLVILTVLGAIPTAGLTGNDLIMANYLNENQILLSPSILEGLAGLSGEEYTHALRSISPLSSASDVFASEHILLSLNQYVSNACSEFRRKEVFARTQDRELGVLFDEFMSDNDPWKERNWGPRKEEERACSVWLLGFGDVAHQNAQDQVSAFHYSDAGFLLGGDYRWDGGIVGAAAAYDHLRINRSDHYGQGTVNFGSLTVYGLGVIGDYFIEASLWGGCQHTKNERPISFPGMQGTARGSYNSYVGDVHAEGGYTWGLSSFAVEPFVALDWVMSRDQKYTEWGAAPLNMVRPSHFSSMLQSEVGLNGYYTYTGAKGILSLRGKMSYMNRTPFQVGRVNAALVGAPTSFTVVAFTGSQNLFSPSVEILFRTRKGFYASLFDAAQMGSGFWSNQSALTVGRFF